LTTPDVGSLDVSQYRGVRSDDDFHDNEVEETALIQILLRVREHYEVKIHTTTEPTV
jgi:hypothetical protein